MARALAGFGARCHSSSARKVVHGAGTGSSATAVRPGCELHAVALELVEGARTRARRCAPRPPRPGAARPDRCAAPTPAPALAAVVLGARRREPVAEPVQLLRIDRVHPKPCASRHHRPARRLDRHADPFRRRAGGAGQPLRHRRQARAADGNTSLPCSRPASPQMRPRRPGNHFTATKPSPGRHDACRSLYGRSRRRLFIGHRPWQTAGARVLQRCSGHKGRQVAPGGLPGADSLSLSLLIPVGLQRRESGSRTAAGVQMVQGRPLWSPVLAPCGDQLGTSTLEPIWDTHPETRTGDMHVQSSGRTWWEGGCPVSPKRWMSLFLEKVDVPIRPHNADTPSVMERDKLTLLPQSVRTGTTKVKDDF